MRWPVAVSVLALGCAEPGDLPGTWHRTLPNTVAGVERSEFVFLEPDGVARAARLENNAATAPILSGCRVQIWTEGVWETRGAAALTIRWASPRIIAEGCLLAREAAILRMIVQPPRTESYRYRVTATTMELEPEVGEEILFTRVATDP